ncbi:DM13 domain-containing protein [Streptomyces sp. NPDC059979]|uniref:DM13 domain-containing protein n=1 Tax=Streptomyces sp. NPDC059979 TaxID=3347021 RepID=UPI003680BF31
MTRTRRRGRLVVAVSIAVSVVLGAGLYWLQPWKLWQDETVREALPTVAGGPSGTGSSGTGSSGTGAPPAAPVTVARGTLISHEHSTTGAAELIRLPDGSHTLRLVNLDTSNGPDLRVWLADAPVKEGVAGWRVFDDGKYVSLGKLKGNKGDQNYPVPAGVNVADYTSISIWCDRFDVSFGAASLTSV